MTELGYVIATAVGIVMGITFITVPIHALIGWICIKIQRTIKK